MPQVAPLTRLLAPREIALRWGCKVDVVLGLIHAGKLPAFNVGLGAFKGRYRVDPVELARFEEARRVQSPPRRGRRSKAKRLEGWIAYFGSTDA